MFNKLKLIIDRIRHLNISVENYKQDSIIQSLPTVAFVNKAKKFIEKKNIDEAEKILLKALDISEQDSRVYKYLGKICEFKRQYPQACEYYDKSTKLNPQDKEIWLRLGMCLLSSKDYEQAIKAFERADKITPLNTDVQTGWGMALMRMKKYALARDKFALACKISKYNYSAILLSAVMEIRLCDYDSAEQKLKFLTKTAPNESSNYEYANLKLLKSDFKAAEQYAKKSLEFNKQMLPSYFILGEVYSIKKEIEKTHKTFSTAIKNDLDCDNLQFEWGKACVRLFDFEQAKEHFQNALEKNPEHLDSKIVMALICALENDFNLVDSLKEKYGSNVYIQESIGLKYLASGKIEDSIEMFKKALRTDKRQTYNLLHLARAYQKLNNNDKVRDYFEKFTIENPQYTKGLIEYAKWLMSISDYADAKRKLTKAEKLEPENNEVLNLLFYSLYVLVKENISEYNIKEAISIAQKSMKLGDFEYKPEKQDLENILRDIQEK